MSNGSERIKDLLSAPMEAVIIALGVGIAKAQRELDLHAIDLQKEINEDPLLSEYGLQPTFYQIPKAELELNIAIAMEEQSGKTKAPTASAALKALAPYQVTFMPVPPPAAESAVTPRLTRDDVMKLATAFLKSTGEVPARLAVNFNGQGRMWFVLQYRVEADSTLTRLALVVIDDDTGTVVKHA
jgi:hypothetical protein